ncbi:MAG: radical SAM-associated putative lipoprotein [Prevotella sp.]|nr:radical SAM-associated putative lipoprotein [Prevotella sp.]
MKARFYHWYNALLSTLLTILGFGSCTNVGEDEYGSPVICEYGTPWANYEVKGVVTDETGAPVSGIKTSIKEVYKRDDGMYTAGKDSTLTDAKGQYQLNSGGRSYEKLMDEDGRLCRLPILALLPRQWYAPARWGGKTAVLSLETAVG